MNKTTTKHYIWINNIDYIKIDNKDYIWLKNNDYISIKNKEYLNKQEILYLNKQWVSSYFTAKIRYDHFGEIVVGAVDMRGEVGVLTRSIVIEGETEDECPSYNGNCDRNEVRDLDTFGGHIKVGMTVVSNGYAVPSCIKRKWLKHRDGCGVQSCLFVSTKCRKSQTCFSLRHYIKWIFFVWLGDWFYSSTFFFLYCPSFSSSQLVLQIRTQQYRTSKLISNPFTTDFIFL